MPIESFCWMRYSWINPKFGYIPDWREQVVEAFTQGGSVSLIAHPDDKGDLKSARVCLAAEPLELGFLRLPTS